MSQIYYFSVDGCCERLRQVLFRIFTMISFTRWLWIAFKIHSGLVPWLSFPSEPPVWSICRCALPMYKSVYTEQSTSKYHRQNPIESLPAEHRYPSRMPSSSSAPHFIFPRNFSCDRICEIVMPCLDPIKRQPLFLNRANGMRTTLRSDAGDFLILPLPRWRRRLQIRVIPCNSPES